MPHQNNKQNKNTNQIISRGECHLPQPCPSEEKQTNKNLAQISSYTKLTKTTGPVLGGQKPKGRKNSTFFKEIIQLSLKPGKGDLKHNNLKKIMKRQRNTSQMKEKTRNTEVQINEVETGKLPEKEFRMMIVNMIKNLENKMKKNVRIN